MEKKNVNAKASVRAEPGSDLPAGLAKAARHALAAAGYTRLEQFACVSEEAVMQLHGVGPEAVDLLRCALGAKGLAFCRANGSGGDHRGDEQPPPDERQRARGWLDII